MGYYKSKLKCQHCGEDFFAGRRDAKYCSANCRKAASRRKESVERTGANIIASIASLNRDRDLYPDLAPLIDQIKESIVEYAIFGIRDTRPGHENNQVVCVTPGHDSAISGK